MPPMEQAGQVIVAVLCMGGFFALFVLLAIFGARQRAQAQAAWSAFAQETGMQLSGVYPMFSFHGSWGGAAVSLMHTMHRGHKGSRHYAHHVSVQLPVHTGDLMMDREGFFDTIGKAFGGQDIQIGDAVFDPSFRVRCSSEELARSVLGPGVRQALLRAVQQLPSLHVEGGRIGVRQPGIATPTTLRPQIDALVAVANAFAQQQGSYTAPTSGGNPYGNPYGMS